MLQKLFQRQDLLIYLIFKHFLAWVMSVKLKSLLFQTLKNTGIKDNPGKNCFVLLKIPRELHLDDCMSLAFDG